MARFFNAPNLIHLFVENWLFFIVLLKYINLLFYYSFDIYLPIFYLLRYDFL